METVFVHADLKKIVDRWRSQGSKIAFVPTMGALHEGHLALVNAARADGAKVVVSIFVNPLQFGPSEDFARYPRTLRDDIEKLAVVSADVVFAPSAADVYPEGFQTNIHNKLMANGLCGRFRPGHFDGVLTVVAKLLFMVQPHMALFGKKDYQQWRLIERMVRDFMIPVEIRGYETIRESDGLAMSSRNRYLSAEERAQAALIYRGLSSARAAWKNGNRSLEALLNEFSSTIATCPKMTIQYADIVDQMSLQCVGEQVPDHNVVMIVAVLFGDVRLIDNLEF